MTIFSVSDYALKIQLKAVHVQLGLTVNIQLRLIYFINKCFNSFK